MGKGEFVMSKIDKLIQELQLKKKKIDYLKYIKDMLTGDQKCIDYVEVQEEVLSKLTPLIDKLAEAIEDGVESTSTVISKEEMDSIKLLLQKVKQKESAPVKIQTGSPSNAGGTPPAAKSKKTIMTDSDKINFAMDNRHLGNKKVKVLNDQNMDITGTVVGLDAPFVIVKTNSGPTIEVPLEKVEMI